MCTAISDGGVCHLFGRTLDLEYSYGEKTVIAPRAFPFNFLYEWDSVYHLAVLGTAHVVGGVPLFFDAVNERGLAIAALNFPHNAVYSHTKDGMHNIASFELIPWLLGRCDSVRAATELLQNTNIVSDSVSNDLPPAPLHWLIADRHEAITAEPMCGGLKIYDNPFGVLTNSPRFDFHTDNLSSYMHLSPETPVNRLYPNAQINAYTHALGSVGLPGDMSSASRFVRAVYAKAHTSHSSSDAEEISRFFHIMDTVSQPEGLSLTSDGKPVRTVYTSCIDTQAVTYYYTTYNCRRIQYVHLGDHSISSSELICFPREDTEDITAVRKRDCCI